ncbi:MAG TPA: AMP nucleosidase [Aestuariivirgaceae bacterium]|nr:AMP nucleosidase [Aestuariivirgaceae bacterium]
MKTTAATHVLSPEAAVDRLVLLHRQATDSLRRALDEFVRTRNRPLQDERTRYCYPELSVTYSPNAPQPSLARAYAKFQGAGVYATTVTQPEAFRPYLVEQLTHLVNDYGATIAVDMSDQEIPYPYVLEHGDELEHGGVSALELAHHFPAPHLFAVGDEIADGTWDQVPGRPRPLALFDAARVDYSLRRLVHYSGTPWQHFQSWILLTNYHRYVDQFVSFAVARLQEDGPYTHLHLPGGETIGRGEEAPEIARRILGAPWHRYQMPAYHLTSEKGDGITLVNIGVGPSNSKTMTDHLAVLRPHCWLMIGHCGGLRQSQRIGDYVLAHGYLRQDRILDSLVPPEIPIPALAEVQVALQQAAARVTGEQGEALKARLRTGTVVTNVDRNWELRWSQERKRINLSRAIAVDMESGTVATQGYRLRVPYGTLLCVSDKPLHGEIKLPGAANAFYDRAIQEHLLIGIAALDGLKRDRRGLHSRKLRSFDEPPFR